MSQKDMEIVRLATEPHNGEDMVPVIREFLAGVVDWSDTDAVVAAMANEANGRHLHSEVEWDNSGQGLLGVAHGLYEVATGWREWVEVWESYVYEMREYRDLGDWVFTVNDVRALGRGGIPVEMRSFQVWQVRDDKIVIVRTFLSEAEALKAAGLAD